MKRKLTFAQNWRYWLRMKRLLDAGASEQAARIVARTQLICECGTIASHVVLNEKLALLCDEHAEQTPTATRLPQQIRRALTTRQAEALAILAADGQIVTTHGRNIVENSAEVKQFCLSNRSVDILLAYHFIEVHDDIYRSKKP